MQGIESGTCDNNVAHDYGYVAASRAVRGEPTRRNPPTPPRPPPGLGRYQVSINALPLVALHDTPVSPPSCFFQGVKRLSSSLYFSAHPEVPKGRSVRSTAAATAAIKTNPNWGDIRYEPQHHRIARDGSNSIGGGPATKPGIWSGAKVRLTRRPRHIERWPLAPLVA